MAGGLEREGVVEDRGTGGATGSAEVVEVPESQPVALSGGKRQRTE